MSLKYLYGDPSLHVRVLRILLAVICPTDSRLRAMLKALQARDEDEKNHIKLVSP